MKRDRIRPLLVVLLGLLAFASLPLLSRPPETPSPEAVCPPCDDFNDCTTDTCDTSTGTCRYEAVSCDDGNTCTQDSCNPTSFNSCNHSGCCNRPLSNVVCDDGSSCTTGDFCASGVCRGSALPEGTACDDGNSCTGPDICNPTGICLRAPLPLGTACDDSSACTTADTCTLDAEGVPLCLGAAVSCSDGTPCTQDVCDPVTGDCSNPPVDCDDGNQCTADSLLCAGGLVCEHTPIEGPCQDFDPCSPNDVCSNGVCTRSGICDDHIACTRDFCNGPAGCIHTPDSTLCADNNPCTFNNSCNPTAGCVFQIHFGAPCNSGDVCTQGFCDLNAHCGGIPGDRCNDFNQCTQDLCDSTTGACSNLVTTGGPCEDSNPCTVGDTCASGTCMSGSIDPAAGRPQLTVNDYIPNLLSPVNHQLVPVHADLTAQTECGGPLQAILVSITSNQPDDAPGPTDGHTTQDIQGADFGTPDVDFLLRAESDRSLATPRIYSITYSITANGFTFSLTGQVHVAQKGPNKPHQPSPSLNPQKPADKDGGNGRGGGGKGGGM